MKGKRWKNFVSYASVLLIWDLASRVGWLEPTILPPPLEVLKTLGQLIITNELFADSGVSLWRVFVGFAIACIVGISLGVLAGTSRRFKEYATPLLEVLRPIPQSHLFPSLFFGLVLEMDLHIF